MSKTAVAKADFEPRECVVAMLLAAGKYEVPEVARSLGIKPSDVYRLRERADFQALIADYAARFTVEQLDEVRGLLNRDAPANFEFLKGVRTGNIVDDPKMLALRVQASRALWDNQVEKKTATDAGPKIVVNIDATAVRALQKVMLEDDADVIDIEAV
jgi:hypothetical protein